MTDQYLKYPLKIYHEAFHVVVTQPKEKFVTSLLYTKDDNLCIRQEEHLTLHLAILWANNELEYLERLNRLVTKKESDLLREQ